MFGLARDAFINELIVTLGNPKMLVAYSILTMNPVHIVVTGLAAKFGISKLAVMVILAFLL